MKVEVKVMDKVTLYFKGGGSMTFKVKNFEMTKKGGEFTSARWDHIKSQKVSFNIDEVIGVKIKKVWF